MSSNKTVERSGAFRPLTDSERHLLSTLLNCEFPGNVSLRKQFSTVMGRQIDDNGSLELQTRGGPFAEVVRRIPVEAEIKDSDGVTIHILIMSSAAI